MTDADSDCRCVLLCCPLRRSCVQSAFFNFQSLLTVVLLMICLCTYIHTYAPTWLDAHKKGSVRGERARRASRASEQTPRKQRTSAQQRASTTTAPRDGGATVQPAAAQWRTHGLTSSCLRCAACAALCLVSVALSGNALVSVSVSRLGCPSRALPWESTFSSSRESSSRAARDSQQQGTRSLSVESSKPHAFASKSYRIQQFTFFANFRRPRFDHGTAGLAISCSCKSASAAKASSGRGF